MPNHVTNHITSTSEDVLARIAAAFEGEGADALVDFNKLIPMPEEINTSNEPIELVRRAEIVLGLKKFTPPLDRPEAWHNRPLCDPDIISDERFELFISYLRAGRKHGHVSWYEWSIAHWGTKWNAYKWDVVDGRYVRFETAWSCPEQIVEALAAKVPGPWVWEYADEDIGNNCGTWACDANGRLWWSVPDAANARAFALGIKGEDEGMEDED